MTLAVGAAYLISEPLVLQVFAQEIHEQRIKDAEVLRTQFRAEIDGRPDFVARVEEAKRPATEADAEVAALQKQADELREAADREERGEGATGERSCGRVCRGYRSQQEAKLAEVRAAKGELPAAEATAATDAAAVEDAKVEAVNRRVDEYGKADGFAARHEALQSYLAGSVTAQMLRWSLTAVLVLVDLLVLTFKILGAQTLHDVRMKTERAIVRDRLDKDLAVAKDRSLADAREESEEVAAFAREQAEKEREAARERRDRAHGRRGMRVWAGRQVDRLRRRVAGDDSGLAPSPDRERRRRDARTGKHRPGTGDVVGSHYRLAEEIGRGGYGVVYRAEVRGGRDAAVKIQPGGRASKGFWSDVRNIPRKGKYVAEVLDAGPHGSWRYVVYPLYRPGSLDRVCATVRESRTALWCLEVIEQTLYAVAAGHSSPEHIVHRDIKPGNILLDGDMVRVSDWGRARSDADGDSTALGTWKWAAPEVFDNRGGLDTSDGLADLYSAGAVAYWLLSGQPPLAREISDLQADYGDEGRVFAENRRLRPRPLDRIDSRIPRPIAQLVDDWLAERPRDRAHGQPEDLACLLALKLLRAAMADEREALEKLILTPGPDPTQGAARTREPGEHRAGGGRDWVDGAARVNGNGNGNGNGHVNGVRVGAPLPRHHFDSYDPTPPEPSEDGVPGVPRAASDMDDVTPAEPAGPGAARRTGSAPSLRRKEVISPPDRFPDVDTDDGDPTPSNR